MERSKTERTIDDALAAVEHEQKRTGGSRHLSLARTHLEEAGWRAERAREEADSAGLDVPR